MLRNNPYNQYSLLVLLIDQLLIFPYDSSILWNGLPEQIKNIYLFNFAKYICNNV